MAAAIEWTRRKGICPRTPKKIVGNRQLAPPSKMIRDLRIPSEKRGSNPALYKPEGVRLIAEVQQGSRSAWGCQLEGETERARFAFSESIFLDKNRGQIK